jgi:exonuclease SbcD
MKFIHTGDWHLGKIINEFSMIEDQRFVLNELIEIIEKEKPDAIVIAGDIYDRSIPTVEAIELLDYFLERVLIGLKTPVLAIAGNHDGAERLSFASGILDKHKLFIEAGIKKHIRNIIIQDEFGPVNFYLLPYLDPREGKLFFKDDSISSHEQLFKKLMENLSEEFNAEERNVLIAHGYVSGSSEEEKPETSESERPLSIGGTEVVSKEHFKKFNYTALGHLHGGQKVGLDNIRYSGSLLKYSFSEVKQRKSVTLVELDETGRASLKTIELLARRDMRIISGPLKELIKPEVYSKANKEDYVFAILTDTEELIDPISKLRAVYPNIMGLKRENLREREDSKTSASEGYKNKSKLQLFEEFYEAIAGAEISKEKCEIVKKVIEQVEKERI